MYLDREYVALSRAKTGGILLERQQQIVVAFWNERADAIGCMYEHVRKL